MYVMLAYRNHSLCSYEVRTMQLSYRSRSYLLTYFIARKNL